MKNLMTHKTIPALSMTVFLVSPYTAQANDTVGNVSRIGKIWERVQSQSAINKITDGSKWEVVVGAGVMAGSKYEGSDEIEVLPLPYIEAEWNDRVFFSPGDGLGVHVYKGQNVTVDVSLGYDDGRKEKDDRKNLTGLGEIDSAAVASLSVEYEFGPVSPYVSVSQHLGGTDGLEAEIGLQTMIPLAALTGNASFSDKDDDDKDGPMGPALMFGLSANWASDDYMEEYFGVNVTQSANSGLSQYVASSGFKSIDADIGLMIPVSENWAVNGHVGYSQLIGDAADSPIVKEEGQVFGGVFVSYQF